MSMDKKHCAGCRNDFYNHGRGLHGVCWSLAEAKRIMRKRVHMDERPPWTRVPELLPSCYHTEGYNWVFVKPEVNQS